MKLWIWIKGRQHGCNYIKFTLWYFKIWKWGFDAYILKYRPFAVLSGHKDEVKNGKHWRLNIKITGKASFTIIKDGVRYSTEQRINLFRPDLYEHSLLVYKEGCTKFSFGFVKFN